jgi:hypothetical protein
MNAKKVQAADTGALHKASKHACLCSCWCPVLRPLEALLDDWCMALLACINCWCLAGSQLSARLMDNTTSETPLALYCWQGASMRATACVTSIPAICAGTANMRALLGSTAVPPGTYRPTALMGRVTRPHVTPGIVSTDTSVVRCASWKALMFAYATSKALVTSSGS